MWTLIKCIRAIKTEIMKIFFSEYSFFIFFLFFISWRPVTLQYCNGLCHTLTWIIHGYTCIPHPDPPKVFYKYTVLWICDQIKYVILHNKRHLCVCVFSPSSGSLEQFWVKGTGVCSCCVTHSFPLPFMPQAHPAWVCLLLWLKTSRCQTPRGTGIQPLLRPPPPCSSPGRGAPAWPGPARPPSCGVSESCLGLLGSLEVQTGSESCWEGLVGPGSLGFFWGPSLVGLLPLRGHLPLLSFLHPHHSGSGGSALQPHGDPTPFPWTLG